MRRTWELPLKMEDVVLPHETNRLVSTDGGTETWLEYKRGLKLIKRLCLRR